MDTSTEKNTCLLRSEMLAYTMQKPVFQIFRKLINSEVIEEVRACICLAAWRRGWIERPDDNRTSKKLVRLAHHDPEFVAFQAEVLASDPIVSLRVNSNLQDAIAIAANSSVKPIQADVCRITFPNEPNGTPPHQDAAYLRQFELWTAWIPLFSCPLSLGPLEFADPSSATHLHAHSSEGIADKLDCSWQSVPVGVGDVVIFNGRAIHRSRPNRTCDRVRLSVDLRFAALTAQDRLES